MFSLKTVFNSFMFYIQVNGIFLVMFGLLRNALFFFCSSTSYEKDCHFSIDLPLHLCQKSIDHTDVDLFLDSIYALKTLSDNTMHFCS